MVALVRLDRPGLADEPAGASSPSIRVTARGPASLLGLVVAQIALGSWLRHYRHAGRARGSRRSWRWRSGLMPLVFARPGRAAAERASRAARPVGAGALAVASTLQIVLGIVRDGLPVTV